MLRSFVHPGAVALAVLALLAAPAPAQPRNPGPDVIVGDIPDCYPYGTSGAGSTVYAFDLGTVSCNTGNVNIRWQVGTSYHPVITQNVYRLKAGRFEQIGMSWAKHGFFAFSENLCLACNGQGGSVLGVGCSDPYDGGLNGDQSGLGPRSEINATTGVFPFVSPHGWPPVTDQTSRRIRIEGADLDAATNPGAQYFGEVMYITPDDAQAGNGWNNASWGPISFGNSSTLYTPAVAGPIHRTQPAVFAWKAAQPTVRLAAYDVPGDGRFWVAHDVTDNGNGTWHYEYAVFNLNSDRSGAGFTVPIAPGTVVSNAAARLPAYHSGEPYTNAPWTINTGATAVTFSVPETFAANPNASALRWATTGTFRFDAGAPPGEGSVSIGLFKPGSGAGAAVTSFAVSVRTPGGAAISLGAPVNDECAGAVALHAGENRSSTLGATASAGGACASMTGDVWFKYTFQSYTGAAGCPGSVTIDTCGSEFDTALAVYAGAGGCPSGSPTPLACNDDAPAGSCPGSPGSSLVTFAATEGATYLVRVGSPTGARGNLVVNVTPPFCVAPNGACCSTNGQCQIVQGAPSCFSGMFVASATTCTSSPCPSPGPPPNDHCDGAIALGDTLLGWPSAPGTNVNADLTVNETCAFGASGGHDVWYTYSPTQPGTVVIDTCQTPANGVGMDTILSVHSGMCDGPILVCNDDASGFCPPESRVSFAGVPGALYFIRITGFGAVVGDFVVRVAGGAGTPLGACCWGASCAVGAQGACAGPNRVFVGPSTACSPATATMPCCRADFNHSGTISVQDLFDFLGAWFTANPAAGVGGDGVRPPTIQDLFDFLAAWFTAGC